MAANLEGVLFTQIYTDNDGGPEFDSDGDGTATQEDEFVAIQNTSSAPVDVSGWQIWSDSTGGGATDAPQDGLYHTFPPGTVLAPGQEVFVINEITGPVPGFAQEASEGGVESGPGAPSTNLLTEGSGGGAAESIALVNPDTGEFIVFNMSPNASTIPDDDDFPGTTSVGEEDGSSVRADPGAGFSYQYDPVTDTYSDLPVFVPCFTEGTRIAVPDGEAPVETLVPGDLVLTADHGPCPLRAILRRTLTFARDDRHDQHKPVLFNIGSLGDGAPHRPLAVSPQHRMLVRDEGGDEVLAPAKGLLHRRGVRRKAGCRQVVYLQLVFDQHEVVCAEGAWSESFFPGAYAVSASDCATQRELFEIFPDLNRGLTPDPARKLLRVQEARALAKTGA
ncbi:MAG: Hint domain-containing protein [Pseudomonadota bacterium]